MSPWMNAIVAVAFVGLAARSVLIYARQRKLPALLGSIAILVGLASEAGTRGAGHVGAR